MSQSVVLSDFIDEYKPQIESQLANQVKKDVSNDQLADSMSYSLMAGGKRLRPLMSIATLKMLNHEMTDDDLKAISALELLHTYSLIHDDLPAMDDDDLRRGKKTNHVIYGAGLATLAGDGLLTLAFQWLTDNDLDDHKKAQLVYYLSKFAGPSGMVAGQSMDILNENKQLSLDEIKKLHEGKTGALIRYAMIAGGILADASHDVIDKLDQFGADYGLAFQIYDDILDVVSSQEELGKPVHQDGVKNTYTNHLGLDKSYSYLEDTISHSRQILDELKDENDVDTELLSSFLDYFKIEK